MPDWDKTSPELLDNLRDTLRSVRESALVRAAPTPALAREWHRRIPPKANRKEQREYDKYLYKLRHLVENAFLHLKQWRGIAIRYAKRSASYLAAVPFRCTLLWIKIS